MRFGSLAAVLAADKPSLRTAVPDAPEVADITDAARGVMVEALASEIDDRPIMSDGDAVIAYLQARLSHERREVLWTIFLDAKHHRLADEAVMIGSVREARAYPREIVRRALEVGATSIILAHNHPSGDPDPSHADLRFSETIASIGRTLDIHLADHIIIARSRWASLRAMGKLS